MLKAEKVRVGNILRNINLDKEVINFYIDMISYCYKNKIHALDVNLTKDIYPMLSEKYDLATDTIENKLIAGLKKSYNKTSAEVYYNTLKYNKKISIKKLLIVLLLELEKDRV